jgi:hypothetical protein
MFDNLILSDRSQLTKEIFSCRMISDDRCFAPEKSAMSKKEPSDRPPPEDKKLDIVFGVALKKKLVTIAHRRKKVPSALVREIVHDHLEEYGGGSAHRIILDDEDLVTLVDQAADLLATDAESLLRLLVTEHIPAYIKAGRDRKQKLKELRDELARTLGDNHNGQ